MSWLSHHLRSRSRRIIAGVVVFLAAVTLAVAHGQPALAQFSNTDAATAAGQFGLSTVNVDLRELIIRIVKYLLSFLGIVAILILIYGGFVWMTSRGDAKRVELAKKIIINALIGLVIVILSYVIVNVMLRTVERVLSPAVITCSGPADAGKDCTPAGGCQSTCNASSQCVQNNPSCVTGTGGSNRFRVRISPTDGAPAVHMNVPVKFRFNKFPNPINLPGGASATGVFAWAGGGMITITTEAGDPVPGEFTRTVYGNTNPPLQSQTLTFVPSNSVCPGNVPRCFDKNTKYKVHVESGAGGVVVISTAETLACDTTTPCDTTFTTSDKVDITGPDVTFLAPASTQVPNAAGVKFQTQADDESGIDEVKLTPLDALDAPIVATQTFPGLGASTFLSTLSPDLDFSTVPIGTSRKFSVEATDEVGNTTTEVKTAIVRPLHCTNGVQDAGEVGRDCGIAANCSACAGEACNATPNQAPALCTANNLACASNACSTTTCTCLAAPIITSIDPGDGKAGNYVTIRGTNFGNTPGTIAFIGATGTQNLAAALAPCSVVDTWTDTQIVVVVPNPAGLTPPVTPTNASPWTSAIKVTASGGLSDTTIDSNGKRLVLFEVNQKERPGLCSVTGANPACTGTQAKFTGIRFGASQGAGKAMFGSISGATVLSGWGAGEVRANVPSIRPSTFGAYIQDAAGEKSNALDFTVESCQPKPRVDSITPANGPNGQTVTIFGTNFGTQKGLVYFDDSGNAGGELVPGDVNFPAACSASGFWRDNQIIVKVPAADKLSIASGQTRSIPVYVQRPDGEKSNADKNFVLNTNPATPALYCIVPDNGPAGRIKIDFIGDQLGVAAPGNAVKFSAASGQINASLDDSTWAKQKISQVLVPAGAKTGATNVVLAGKVCAGNRSKVCVIDTDCSTSERPCMPNASNPANFTAGACKTDDQCNVAGSTDRECCASEGVCRPTGSCPQSTVVPDGSYRWRFTVGEAKVAPQVIEQQSCPVAGVATAPPNLLNNGDFEAATTAPWQTANPPVLADTDPAAPAGPRYMITNASLNLLWQEVPTNGWLAGEAMTLTYYAKGPGAISAFLGAVDNYTVRYGELDDDQLLTNDWALYSATYIVPANLPANIVFVLEGSTGAISVDGVVLSRAVGSQAIIGTQSPSPYKSSTDACTNSVVSVRFTTPLASSIPAAAVEVKKCTGSGNNPCSATSLIAPLNTSQPSLVATDGLRWQPLTAWEGNTTYQVTLKREHIKSNKDVAMVKDYQWTFRTSTTCDVKVVSCSPGGPTSLTEDNSELVLTAEPQAGNCNILACGASVGWQPNNNPHMTLGAFNGCLATAGAGTLESPAGQSTNFRPTVQGKTATEAQACKVINTFKALAVSEAFPRCAAACVNADVGAVLTTDVALATVNTSTVLLYACQEKRECEKNGQDCTTTACPASQGACISVPDDSCKAVVGPSKVASVTRDATKRKISIVVAGGLQPKTVYRAILTNGITSEKGKALGGLNYDQGGVRGYSWVFGTSDKECKVSKVVTEPSQAIVKTIGATAIFSAQPWSAADACSPNGQRLNPYLSDYAWSATTPTVGQLVPSPAGRTQALPGPVFKTCGGVPTAKQCAVAADCPSGIACSVVNFYNPSQTVQAVGTEGACKSGAGKTDGTNNACSTDIATGTPDTQKKVASGTLISANPPAKFTLQCGFAPAGSCVPQDTISVNGVDGRCSDDGNKVCRSNADCGSSGGQCLGQGDANCDGQVNLTDLDVLTKAVAGTCTSNSCTGNKVGSACTVDNDCRKEDSCPGLNVDASDNLIDQNDMDGPKGLKSILQSRLSRCSAGKVGQLCKVNADCTSGTTAGVCATPSRVCSNDRSVSCAATAWGAANQSACSAVKTGNQCGGGTPAGTCNMGSGKCSNDATLSCSTNSDCQLAVNTAGCCGVRPYVLPQPKGITWAESPLESPKMCPNTVIKVTFNTVMNSASVIKNTSLMRALDTGGSCQDFAAAPAPWWQRAWRSVANLFTREADAAVGAVLCPLEQTVTTRTVLSDPLDPTSSVQTQAVISPKQPLRADQRYWVVVRGGLDGATGAAGIAMADGQFTYDLTPPGIATNLCAIANVQVKIAPDLSAAQEYRTPRSLTKPYDIFNCAGNNCTCTTPDFQGCRILNGGVRIGEDQRDAQNADVALQTNIDGNQHVYTALPVSATGGELTAGNYAWNIVAPSGLLTPHSSLSGAGASSLVLSNAADRNGVGNVTVKVSAGSATQRVEKSATVPVSIFLCQNPWTGAGPNGLVDVNNNFSTTYCKDGPNGGLPDFEKTAEVPTTGNGSGTTLKDFILKAKRDMPDGVSDSPDAIGIRVVTNRWHSSPQQWYDQQRFPKGSPQSIVVDGYPAIRDGRTLYVGAGNFAGANLYTNIYILSYNQGARPATVQVFNQLIKNLNFNINQLTPGQCRNIDNGSLLLEGAKKCTNDGSTSCLVDAECKLPAAIAVPVDNNSFENGLTAGVPTGYRIRGSAGVVEALPSGSHYFKFTNNTNTAYLEFTVAGTVPTPDLELMAGRNYRLSFNVRSSVPNAGGHVKATFLGHPGGGQFAELGQTTITNNWQRVSGTQLVDNNVALVQPLITISADTVGTLIDDITFEYIGGACQNGARSCVTNNECQSGYICDSTKAGIARDVQRLSDVLDMAGTLEDYRYGTSCPTVSAGAPGDADCNGTINAHDLTLARGYAANLGESYNANVCSGADINASNSVDGVDVTAIEKLIIAQCKRPANITTNYPSLNAGSYMPGASTSAWPSWAATLGTGLGTTLPTDPRNRFAANSCTGTPGNGYDTNTCWDNTNKKFIGGPSDSDPSKNLANKPPPAVPVGSYLYTYSSYSGGSEYAVCTFLESCSTPQPNSVGTKKDGKRFCTVSSSIASNALPAYVSGGCSGSSAFVPPPAAADLVDLTVNLQAATPAALAQGVVRVTPVSPSSTNNGICEGLASCEMDIFKDNSIVVAASVTNPESVRFDRWVGGCGSNPSSPVCVLTPSAPITVTARFVELPAGITLTASSNTVTSGQPVTLTWQGRKVFEICSISGVTKPATGWPTSGSTTIASLSATTTYEIRGKALSSGTCGDLSDSVIVNVAARQAVLTLTKQGGGQGSVVSSPAGIITCDTSCPNATGQVTPGTTVRLTATPAAGSNYATSGVWGNTCIGNGGTQTVNTCTVQVNSNMNIEANFTSTNKTLTVGKITSGTSWLVGNGTVRVSPDPAAGTENPCLVDSHKCTYSFANSQSVTLKAEPEAGSSFTGWTGACASFTGDCTITLTGNIQVNANFVRNTHTLTVKGEGLFNGSIDTTASSGAYPTFKYRPNDTPAVTQIVYPFLPDTTILLTASASSGRVSGWDVTPPAGLAKSDIIVSGCLESVPVGTPAGSCSVTIKGNITVTAKYAGTTNRLTVQAKGMPSASDQGYVMVPPATQCRSNTCADFDFPENIPVMLTAVPDTGYRFKSWTCALPTRCQPDPGGDAKKIVADMSGPTTVTAYFEPLPALTVVTNGPGSFSATDGTTTCTTSPCTLFTAGSTITLTASPSASGAFKDWLNGTTNTCTAVSGAETTSGNNRICTFTMPSISTQMNTNFVGTSTLTMRKSGTGSGTYRLNVNGNITDCVVGVGSGNGDQNVSPACVVTIPTGANVVVTATADYGMATGTAWTAVGASGAPSGSIYTYTSFSGPNSTLSIEFSVPPVVIATPFTTSEDTNLVGFSPATDPDGDALTITPTSETNAFGKLDCSGATCTYDPADNFNGTANFTVTATDTTGLPTTGTITITVTSVNDAPTSVAQCTSSDNATRATSCGARVGTAFNLWGDASFATPPDAGDSITSWRWTCTAGCSTLNMPTEYNTANQSAIQLPSTLPSPMVEVTNNPSTPFFNYSSALMSSSTSYSTDGLYAEGSRTYTHPGGSNNMLLVFVTSFNDPLLSGVKFGDISLTPLFPSGSSYCATGIARRVEWWYAMNVASATNPIVISWSADDTSRNGLQIAAVSLVGVNTIDTSWLATNMKDSCATGLRIGSTSNYNYSVSVPNKPVGGFVIGAITHQDSGDAVKPYFNAGNTTVLYPEQDRNFQNNHPSENISTAILSSSDNSLSAVIASNKANHIVGLTIPPAPSSSVGLNYQLTVTDSDGLTNSSNVSVTVHP